MQNNQDTKKNKLFVLIKQFIKFGLVGLSNTLISLGVYYLLVYLNVHYILANIAGFLVSVLNAYYWNSRYVFPKGSQKRRSAFLKCFVAYGFTFLLGTLLLFLMVDQIGISDKVAPIINLCITIPANFLLNKVWAFKEENEVLH
ncbi:MAG: GtrA family protein [Christensenellales bacterium]